MNEAAHLAGFFFVDEVERIEVLDFGGDGACKASRVEAGNLRNPALAGQQIPPDLRAGVAHRTDEAHSSNDDSTAQLLLAAFRVCVDVVDGILDRLDLLGFFVGNLDVEGLFEGHDEFDGVEGVGAEVVHERRIGSNFAFIHAKLFHDDLLYLLIYCGHSRSSLCWRCDCHNYCFFLDFLSLFASCSARSFSISSIAWLTVLIFSASLSGILTSKAASKAMINSTRSRESASTNGSTSSMRTLLLRYLGVLLDVADRVLHGLDLLGFFVGDLEIESFLKGHDELDAIERIGAK